MEFVVADPDLQFSVVLEACALISKLSRVSHNFASPARQRSGKDNIDTGDNMLLEA